MILFCVGHGEAIAEVSPLSDKKRVEMMCLGCEKSGVKPPPPNHAGAAEQAASTWSNLAKHHRGRGEKRLQAQAEAAARALNKYAAIAAEDQGVKT